MDSFRPFQKRPKIQTITNKSLTTFLHGGGKGNRSPYTKGEFVDCQGLTKDALREKP
jgi:hypothetical protein